MQQEHNVSVAKILLLFLSAFLFASAGFLMLWIYIGGAYQNIVFIVAKSILRAMGYSESQISAVNLSGAYLVNFNLVPLFALAAVTPRISLIKRAKILIFGFPLLFSLHVLDIVAHFPLHFYGSELAWFVVNSIGVASIAAPFIIWFIFVQEDLFKILGLTKRYLCPLCGEREGKSILKHISEAHGRRALKSKKVREFLREHPELLKQQKGWQGRWQGKER